LGFSPNTSLPPVLLFLFAVGIVSCFVPALLADDLPAVRLMVAGGDQSSAAADSSLRLLSGDAPVQAVLVRPEAPASPPAAATSVTDPAALQPFFSHTRWPSERPHSPSGRGAGGEGGLQSSTANGSLSADGDRLRPFPVATTREGPAAVVPRGPDLHWKGAFHFGRLSAVADSSVRQASGELLPDLAPPVFVPTPPQGRPGDRSDAQTPSAGPPLPVRMGPPTEPNAAPLPSLEQELAEQPKLGEKCTSPRDLKSIRSITADISVKPEDLTGSKRLPPECSLGDASFRPRQWHCTTFAWTAAATCHNPIYFEDEQLERYGHSWGPVKQTTISAVRFFATVPLVPYFMGVYPPNECIYDLGQYRPGSCAPYYLDPLPISVRGALYEGMFLSLLPAL
jgi:hypothetical protein